MARKTVIKRVAESKVFWAVLSLFLSLLLWMYITSTQRAQTEELFEGIQIEFTGEDTLRNRNLILTTVENASVSLRLSGNKRDIARLQSQKDDIKVVVDLSTITGARGYDRLYEIVYPDNTDRGGIAVVWSSTSTIRITVDRLSSKIIDIKGSFVGEAAEGYMVGQMSIDPLTVRITGSEEELGRVDHGLVTVERTNLSSSIVDMVTDYTLVDGNGDPVGYKTIETETDQVVVQLPIRMVKTVQFGVDAQPSDGLAFTNMKVTFEPNSIEVAGDAADLEALNRISLATVDLNSFDREFEQTYSVALPNNVTNISRVSEVKVHIEIVGLETKTFTVENISFENAPDGFTPQNVTKSLEVTVRASRSVLDILSADNIRAVVDLSEHKNQTGRFGANAKIYIEGYRAEAIYTYEVAVSLDSVVDAGVLGLWDEFG